MGDVALSVAASAMGRSGCDGDGDRCGCAVAQSRWSARPPRLADGGRAPIKLAVLPFRNLTGDPEQEYFSDGLTDEMIMQLGRLHPDRLRVIARSSTMQYKNHEAPIDAMARELAVDYIPEGSARREGNRIRINATLIEARERTQRWSQSFDREISGILTLENDVARGVSGALALSLLPADQARLSSGRQIDPQAYELYLLGQSRARRLTRPDLDRALSTTRRR